MFLCGFINLYTDFKFKILILIKIKVLKTLTILIASVALLYSCDKAKTKVAETEVAKSDSVVNNNITESATVPAPAEVASSVTNVSVSGKPALNPAHGEPYHRCEIAVGAPIDSAPTQNATPQQAAPSILNPNPAPAVSTTPAAPAQAFGPKPAMNPEHGQPHHRCDLAVGAPLT